MALRCISSAAGCAAEAEAELQRDLHEAASLVEQQRAALLDTFTLTARLIADLPKLKAAIDTRRPADRGADRPRLSGAGRDRICSVVTRSGRGPPVLGRDRARRARSPAVARRCV